MRSNGWLRYNVWLRGRTCPNRRRRDKRLRRRRRRRRRRRWRGDLVIMGDRGVLLMRRGRRSRMLREGFILLRRRPPRRERRSRAEVVLGSLSVFRRFLLSNPPSLSISNLFSTPSNFNKFVFSATFCRSPVSVPLSSERVDLGCPRASTFRRLASCY